MPAEVQGRLEGFFKDACDARVQEWNQQLQGLGVRSARHAALPCEDDDKVAVLGMQPDGPFRLLLRTTTDTDREPQLQQDPACHGARFRVGLHL